MEMVWRCGGSEKEDGVSKAEDESNVQKITEKTAARKSVAATMLRKDVWKKKEKRTKSNLST